jgi:soluble lytic murein transglycosylase
MLQHISYYSKPFYLALILSVGLFTAPSSQAGILDLFSGSQSWQNNSQLINDTDPVAKKLVTWLGVTDKKKDVDARELIHFALENSDWPKLYEFRKQIEDDIEDSGLKPFDIAAWFDHNPPRTAIAFKVYAAALYKLNQSQRIQPALKKFWHDADMDKKETLALASYFKNYLSPQDQVDRLENLLWEDRFTEAEYMMPLVSGDEQKVADASIALGRMSSKSAKYLKAVPAAKQNNPVLLYDRLRWRRVMDKDADALSILQHAPKNLGRPDLWWHERNILARRAIEKRKFSVAAQVVANHGLSPTASAADYGTAEWTLGWLQLEYLGQPDKAYQHFDNFYNASNAAVSRSRAAYWLARAADKLHEKKNTADWYRIAAQFPSTFYGQISYEKLKGTTVDASTFRDDQVAPQAQQEFDDSDLVQAVRILHKDNLPKYIDPFLAKMLENAKSRPDFVMVAHLANETGRLHFAVEANKQMQMRIGEFMFTEGYPLLPSLEPKEPESALIHAIIHRESMFNAQVGSPAGAQGLMQLMPATAKQVSRRMGKNYSEGKLTENPEYNVELGADYLQSLLDQYDGFYPLAIAAYNAGPANVATWIREFGDPRSKNVNLLDWIEEIPIYETRNYIQRVMESYYIYKLRLNEQPVTVVELKKG